MMSRVAHLMDCTLHACVGNHTEDAGFETSVKGGQSLVSVNGPSTRHDTVVRAGLLQVQPHLQHLWCRKEEIKTKTSQILLIYSN